MEYLLKPAGKMSLQEPNSFIYLRPAGGFDPIPAMEAGLMTQVEHVQRPLVGGLVAIRHAFCKR
jgi:hypothetical protein